MSDTALAAWAGLGLFFLGVRLLGAHVQELAGGPVRTLLSGALGRPGVPPLAGFLIGAVTQSSSAAVSIAAGLIAAGTIGLAATLPLLAWANVGTSLLVLVAAVDLRALSLFLFGAVGLSYLAQIDRRGAARHALLATLGLGLLLFGLTQLKGSIGALRTDPWAIEFFEFAGSQAAVAYLVGFLLAVPMQSSAIITVLSLPLVQAGLLELHQVALMVYGAGLGAGVGTALLAAAATGPARLAPLCSLGLRIGASAIVLSLLVLEQFAGLPGVLAAASALVDSPATRTGLVFLTFQLAMAATAAVASAPIVRLVERLSPAPVETEPWSRPVYLFDDGLDDPETALSLAGLETRRVFSALPEYLEPLRPAAERTPGSLSLERRHAASTALAVRIEGFLSSALAAHPGMAGVERVFDARARLAALRTLQDTLHAFAIDLGAVPAGERPPLAAHMVEGLHAVLGFAADSVAEDADADAREMLAVLTEERGALMDEVRKSLLGSGLAGRDAMLSATLHFERILWMLRRVAVNRSGADARPAGGPAPAVV